MLDCATQVDSSWRTRYDRLRLNTCRPFSLLPDRPFPKGTPMFPSRDEVIEHLERHAYENGIHLQLGTRVDRIDRDARRSLLRASGEDIRTPQVIFSTGLRRHSRHPGLARPRRVHGQGAALLRIQNFAPDRGSNVLVVGPGWSWMEIAYDLAWGERPRYGSRRGLLRTSSYAGPGGLRGDVLGVLLLRLPARIGDAVAPLRSPNGRRRPDGVRPACLQGGVFSRLRRLGAAPSIVDKQGIEAIKHRRIEIVRGMESLDEHGERLAGGGHVEADVVICATGYRRGLERLIGHLDVLDGRGVPRTRGADAAASGLRFIGYVPRPGGLGCMAKEAKRGAKAIVGELRKTGATRRPQLRLAG